MKFRKVKCFLHLQQNRLNFKKTNHNKREFPLRHGPISSIETSILCSSRPIILSFRGCVSTLALRKSKAEMDWSQIKQRGQTTLFCSFPCLFIFANLFFIILSFRSLLCFPHLLEFPYIFYTLTYSTLHSSVLPLLPPLFTGRPMV